MLQNMLEDFHAIEHIGGLLVTEHVGVLQATDHVGPLLVLKDRIGVRHHGAHQVLGADLASMKRCQIFTVSGQPKHFLKKYLKSENPIIWQI